MKSMLVVLGVFLLPLGGCVQLVPQDTGAVPVAAPAVVYAPTDSSYLLACVNELQELKRKNLERYYKEAASRLEDGNDQDVLRFICLSLHAKAGNKQFRGGEKLLKKFIDEHPDTSAGMEGLLVLFSRLGLAKVDRRTGYKKVVDERDALLKEVETMQLEVKRDQARIQELQGQIEQLKNIESIIKNRER